MAAEDSRKQPHVTTLKKKEKKRSQLKRSGSKEHKIPQLAEGEKLAEGEEEHKHAISGKKRSKRENGSKLDVQEIDDMRSKYGSVRGKEKGKLLRKKKRQVDKMVEAEGGQSTRMPNGEEDGCAEQPDKNEAEKREKSKLRRKKNDNKMQKTKTHKGRDDKTMGTKKSASRVQTKLFEGPEASLGTNLEDGDSEKACKRKNKDISSSKEDENLMGNLGEAEGDEVYQISSGDEDCSRGMKKWIMEHHQQRPGLKILQQRIDEFISAHEAQEEQKRKEREAQAAEGGWTVVVHQKGRKKTTDLESGTTVGSVASAAVMDKMAKKKSREVGLGFYRFQKREAHRNEIMMLQSKFEEDKKRIQQLRAARKFRPY